MRRRMIMLLLTVLTAGTLPAQHRDRERYIDSLISVMTPGEKAGQLSIFTNDWDETGRFIKKDYATFIRQGLAGGIFNAYGATYTRQLQELAVRGSRLGIPLIFAYDVIHGQKTIFPVPLAEAASWDTSAIERSARIAAIEASAAGLHWTFAPMCDISRDPRWGRIMEGAGEDPFLGSVVAAARVRGFQGKGFRQADAVAACVKHFAAYGAVQAGREYHSVDMSERMLRDVYLKPYQAAVKAGALTVMTAFNDLNGIPATCNRFLLTDILRGEWGFDGLVVTDYTSVMELMNHGVAGDTANAAALSLDAGVDVDMQSGFFLHALPELVRTGKIPVYKLDSAVRHVLRLKARLGLFDDPYRFCSEEREKAQTLRPDFLEAARDMARRSMVLLKNDRQVLPLDKNIGTIAVIGPLGDSRRDMIGGWSAAGDGDQAESLLDGLRAKLPLTRILFAKGCEATGSDTSGFSEAIAAAGKADVVILAIGEPAWMSGEATSRANPVLPGFQPLLAEAVATTGKPVVAVLFNGRPLILDGLANQATAILEAWFPGTKGGSALADVLTGDYNPSGKLPVTFPQAVGQIPVHYDMKSTGRPFDPGLNTSSKYLDCPNEPVYSFGFGLSYTRFEYDRITSDKAAFRENEQIIIEVPVTNTGSVTGEEVVQLYVRDVVASVTRPVRELKGFRKVMLRPGERTVVRFSLTSSDLSFYRKDMTFGWEKGTFIIYAGGNSGTDNGVLVELL